MKRFKNILYILDDHSLQVRSNAEKVARLASLNGSTVTVLLASEASLLDNVSMRLSGQQDDIRTILAQQNRQAMETFLSHERWRGIAVTPDHEETGDFIAIIRKVLRNKYDLVIKEATLAQGIDQLSMRLVRKCPCPVWIIKHGADDFRRILAAVDVDTGNPETVLLNRKIVELTHSLAQREGGAAHYLHSWRLEYESMLTSPRINISADEIADMKRGLTEERRSALLDLLNSSQIDYRESNVHLKEGLFSDVVKNTIDSLKVDVVVMGSVGRSGIPGFLIGNRAESVLNAINCTVLTVKPDGFNSPVTLEQ